MSKGKWLVINYNLPTEPSKHRVAVWRGLKKLGAVNIQQSMWLMTYSDENYLTLQKISEGIESNNGTSLLMECVFYDEKHEQRVISLFNTMRDEEYREFINECEKYLKELEKEITIKKFSFAELEEEEEELQKLISWHNKIEARDLFVSSERNAASDILKKIENAFEDYSDLVYQSNCE
ncbi:Chromate resistance protein ChrB [Desulfosporosinus fructosivorans]